MSWSHTVPLHRRAVGERVSNLTWEDARPDLIAEPSLAYADACEAHRWATQARTETSDPTQVYILTQERKRLADIAWRLKRRL